MTTAHHHPNERWHRRRGIRGSTHSISIGVRNPKEPLAYVIDALTKVGDLVIDPFVGSGTAGREALLSSRRFIGFDINPVAIELSRLLIHPPSPESFHSSVKQIEKLAKQDVLQSYVLEDGETIATHYLWDKGNMAQVWVPNLQNGRRRQELDPSSHDIELSDSFALHQSQLIRQPQFFSNGRINATPDMSLQHLLTGRAQRNLDILLDAIEACPQDSPACTEIMSYSSVRPND